MQQWLLQGAPDHHEGPSTLTLLRKSNGKVIAIMDGFTYYCDGRSKTTNIWLCSASSCKARFSTTKQQQFLRAFCRDHRHPPPKFTVHNGFYVKFEFRFEQRWQNCGNTGRFYFQL
ncbi:uncharacterized protein LOC132902208 [Amyelois transitella]|uniref:uncharacterized protein LOC132902208 n=1 Tax=Amyelois transitella TaxID=680683 RepID=UPI0029902D96|nr:uncharacterized protein LOC132902208 [Amyelois transitella]